MTETASKWRTVLNRIPNTGKDPLAPPEISDKIISMPARSLDKLRQDILDRQSNVVHLQCEADRARMAHDKYMAELRAQTAQAIAEFQERYAALATAYREASEALMSAQLRWAEQSRNLGIRSDVVPTPPLPELPP